MVKIKDLVDRFAEISKKAEQSELAGKPEVGIFWINPNSNTIFGDHATPLDVGVGLDGSKTEITTPHTHLDTWKLYQQHGILPPEFKEKKWNAIPRGRVLYDAENKKFHVVGHRLVKEPDIQEQIRSRFKLPYNTQFYQDDHYHLSRD
jgi:hypothetical protein